MTGEVTSGAAVIRLPRGVSVGKVWLPEKADARATRRVEVIVRVMVDGVSPTDAEVSGPAEDSLAVRVWVTTTTSVSVRV